MELSDLNTSKAKLKNTQEKFFTFPTIEFSRKLNVLVNIQTMKDLSTRV